MNQSDLILIKISNIEFVLENIICLLSVEMVKLILGGSTLIKKSVIKNELVIMKIVLD